jgi:hypothetical protein
MRVQLPLALLATALASSLTAAPANAQSIRTFVSTAGSDSNPCSLIAPCRHFQAAVNATSAGGEVDALDAGAYGSFTISQAITIEGEGWSYVAPPSGGSAITINAASGNVTIRGVSLNGVGTTSTNGIVFNSGGSLTVTNCVVQNFAFSGPATGSGIYLRPTSGIIEFAITNTTVANNGFIGIRYVPPSGTPSVNGVIDHVVATGNGGGMGFNTTSASGGTTVVAISNSVASDNINGTGIFADSGASAAIQLSIDNASISGNTNVGIEAGGPSTVILGRSVITGNGTGVDNETSPNAFYTYGDNRIDFNGSSNNANVTGGTPIRLTPQ